MWFIVKHVIIKAETTLDDIKANIKVNASGGWFWYLLNILR